MLSFLYIDRIVWIVVESEVIIVDVTISYHKSTTDEQLNADQRVMISGISANFKCIPRYKLGNVHPVHSRIDPRLAYAYTLCLFIGYL